MHQLLLMCSSNSDMQQFLDCIVSVTTDMGTELGLTEFHTTDFRKCMPEWLRCADIKDDSATFAEKHPNSKKGWEQAWLLTSAIPVPGMMHIVSNLLNEVHAAMPSWSDFIANMSELEKLLCKTPRRERFILSCIRGTEYEAFEHAFNHEFEPMYDKRWHAVLKLLQRMEPVIGMLGCVWDPARYMRGHSGIDGQDNVADDSFSVKAITRAVNNKFLMALVRMLLALDSMVEKLGSWSEGCSCHENVLLSERSDYKRQKKLRRLINGSGGPTPVAGECRLKGKRAPAMASGKLHSFFAKITEISLSDLMQTVRWGLTEEEWQIIASEWSMASAHIQNELRQKLQFWEQLPWLLCAMALPDENEGRLFAAKCVDQYKSVLAMGVDEVSLHRVAQKFLSETSSLRIDMDRWISGEPLAHLPHLQSEVQKLALVPIVERVIESRASHIRAALRSSRSGPVRASLALRMPEFEFGPRSHVKSNVSFGVDRSVDCCRLCCLMISVFGKLWKLWIQVHRALSELFSIDRLIGRPTDRPIDELTHRSVDQSFPWTVAESGLTAGWPIPWAGQHSPKHLQRELPC